MCKINPIMSAGRPVEVTPLHATQPPSRSANLQGLLALYYNCHTKGMQAAPEQVREGREGAQRKTQPQSPHNPQANNPPEEIILSKNKRANCRYCPIVLQRLMRYSTSPATRSQYKVTRGFFCKRRSKNLGHKGTLFGRRP